ncbi:MAG TPA: cytochrome c oxidase assembly protein [Sunxiuqinia sp.]|nr:cytochrome c oxidase assembly protein [Sunxiuqinia sp.]
MTIVEFLTSYWHFDAVPVFLAVALIAFQLITNKNGSKHKNRVFFLGVATMLLVTISPLAYLGMGYLFSAHMVESIVLLLVVPSMLLNGLNEKVGEAIHQSWFGKVGDRLFSVPVAWMIGVGTMYFWHIPAVFEAMKMSHLLHEVHLLSLLVGGLIFKWPVFSPVEWKKLSPMQSAIYLFIACVGCTVLGIFIAFGPADVFTPFFHGGNAAIWSMVRNGWGISSVVDQQAAGLIMWVPACMIYITNVLTVLSAYLNSPYVEAEEI